jgi:hypothetical protein
VPPIPPHQPHQGPAGAARCGRWRGCSQGIGWWRAAQGGVRFWSLATRYVVAASGWRARGQLTTNGVGFPRQ